MVSMNKHHFLFVSLSPPPPRPPFSLSECFQFFVDHRVCTPCKLTSSTRSTTAFLLFFSKLSPDCPEKRSASSQNLQKNDLFSPPHRRHIPRLPPKKKQTEEFSPPLARAPPRAENKSSRATGAARLGAQALQQLRQASAQQRVQLLRKLLAGPGPVQPRGLNGIFYFKHRNPSNRFPKGTPQICKKDGGFGLHENQSELQSEFGQSPRRTLNHDLRPLSSSAAH